MKIAIDGRILTRNVTGTERYISSLAEALYSMKNKDYDLSLLTKPGYENAQSLLKSVPTYVLLENMGIDLFHRTYQIGSYYELLELLITPRSVITVHDLIACTYPEYFHNRDVYDRYMDLMELSLHYVDRVIAISNHNRRDIVDRFGLPENKIDVVYHGIDAKRFHKISRVDKKDKLKSKLNLPDKFILYLGTDYPHKNIDNLLKAFKELLAHSKTKDYYLVIGGTSYYCRGSDYFKDSLSAVKDRVKFIGYLEDEDIPTLYSLADLFVYPSLYEGFGFPVLESFACETPLICSNATSLPEVAGDAAYLVDAKNYHNIAKAVVDVVSNPILRNSLVDKGKKRVTQFTWDKCAQSTYNVYEKALSDSCGFKAKDDFYLKRLFSDIVKQNIMYWERQVVAEESFNFKKILFLFKSFFKSLRSGGVKKTMKIVYKYILKK